MYDGPLYLPMALSSSSQEPGGESGQAEKGSPDWLLLTALSGGVGWQISIGDVIRGGVKRY